MEKSAMDRGVKKQPVRVRPSLTYIASLAIIATLMILLILVTFGIFPVIDWYLNWVGFLDQVITISMLAVLGAVFFGMLIAYRMLTKTSFTPFEHSMLEMSEDVKQMKAKIERLEELLESKNRGEEE